MHERHFCICSFDWVPLCFYFLHNEHACYMSGYCTVCTFLYTIAELEIFGVPIHFQLLLF